MRALVPCLLVACAAPARPIALTHHAPAPPPAIRLERRSVGYWTLGEPIPADQRGPILREPGLAFSIPPPLGAPRAPIGLACHAALAEVARLRAADDETLLAALARLLDVGRSAGGACLAAADDEVALRAELRTQHTWSLQAHAYWMLAGHAASTPARRLAAYRNAALYAWHEARLVVRSALRGGVAFPLEPWIDAGDAFVHAGETALALDAYENALRASRARELTRAQAAHIARMLAQLPGRRAAALRARIQL